MTRRPRGPKHASAARSSAPGLDAVVAMLSLAYVVMVAYVWVRRAAYPYELEWLEGAALEHVLRLRHGLPLYTAPSLAWVPLNYPPLYFELGRAFTFVFGESFLALRLVSIVATIAAGGLLWLLVRRETDRAAPAWLAVGLLAATYRLGGTWFDIARADSLQLALLIAGACVARFDPSRWRMPLVAGTLLALAFFAKQSAALAVGPLLVWLALSDRPRGAVLAGVFAVLAGAGALALDATSGGWFRYHAFTAPGFHKVDPALLWRFPLNDLLAHFGPLLAALALSAWAARGEWARWGWTFHAAFAAGCLALAWGLRVYPGGYDNVLVPAHAALALLGAMAFAALTARRGLWATVGAILLAAQLALLAWNPAAQVPTEADRAAGDQVAKAIATLRGRLYVSSHPYLLERAGRPGHAHAAPLIDVTRDGSGPIEHTLLAQLRDSLAAHVWDQAVLDNRDLLAPEFLNAGYSRVADVFPDARVFWPRTGTRTRPEYLFVSPDWAADSARR